MDERIFIHSGQAKAEIATFGAELKAWSVAGKALLWQGNADSWAKSAPILFPVVGWPRDKRVRINGQAYDMPVHGFASKCLWHVVNVTEHSATLRLEESAQTRLNYPFAFRLDVTISLSDSKLSYDCEVTNRDLEPMPFSLGLHPGFVWPLGEGAHHIEFEQAEPAFVPVIAAGGLFSDEKRAVPLENSRLTLSKELMAREALCFLNLNSRRLIYGAENGVKLECDLGNFAHCAFWNHAGAPFLCIEAWSGHGDPVGFSGEMAEKPSITVLQSKDKLKFHASFDYKTQANTKIKAK